jgi:hypothetical protein
MLMVLLKNMALLQKKTNNLAFGRVSFGVEQSRKTANKNIIVPKFLYTIFLFARKAQLGVFQDHFH